MGVSDVMDALIDVARRLVDQLAAAAPVMLAALGLLVAGWLAGWLLSKGVARLIVRWAPGLEERTTRVTLTRFGYQRRVSELIGGLVFWVVLAVFVVAAVETLGMPVLAAWVGQVGALLPRLFLGGLIVVVGLLAGSVARDAVAAAARAGNAPQADLLGRAAQAGVVVIAVVTGLEQVGVDSGFLTAMMAVLAGGAFGGVALAFALGARTEVGNIVAMHYVRQTFHPGQLVELGEVRGRIHAFTKTTVVLNVDDGQAHVPGRMFSDRVIDLPGSEG